MIELFPYQEVGADFLAGRRRALLLDAPGLGKTAQAIRAADRAGAETLETVCPASVVTQWRKAHADISLTDTVFRSNSYEHARSKGISGRPTVICLDEVHYLKNGGSKRTKALFGTQHYGRDGLIMKADYVWGMTGTPSPRDPSDLYPILLAIVPGALMTRSGKTMDYWQFLNKFCTYYNGDYGIVVSGGCNLAELADRMAPYVLRRSKHDVQKDWKQPVVAELWLDPGEVSDQVKKLEKDPAVIAVADAFKKGGYKAIEHLAEKDDTGLARFRRLIGMLKVVPVVEWLLDQFDDGLEKIVVIAFHREVIEAIHAKLTKENVGAVIYYGGMSPAQKDKAKETFITQPTCRVFIGQVHAAGVGVDGLQKATGDMLFAEWDWIADNNYQTLCRLDRIGQENPVLGRFAGLAGSIDGAIMASAKKRAADNQTLWDNH